MRKRVKREREIFIQAFIIWFGLGLDLSLALELE